MARSMAAISINFIIVVTPWTLKEVVVSCTGAKVSIKQKHSYFPNFKGLVAACCNAGELFYEGYLLLLYILSFPLGTFYFVSAKATDYDAFNLKICIFVSKFKSQSDLKFWRETKRVVVL